MGPDEGRPEGRRSDMRTGGEGPTRTRLGEGSEADDDMSTSSSDDDDSPIPRRKKNCQKNEEKKQSFLLPSLALHF